jgi:hypothetical protein
MANVDAAPMADGPERQRTLLMLLFRLNFRRDDGELAKATRTQRTGKGPLCPMSSFSRY